MAEAGKKRGRPTKYTERVAAKLCARLSDGRSLRSVCEDDDMPGKVTVFRWLHLYEEFRNQYARAKEEAADAMAEEILDIADDGRNDWMEIFDKSGDSVGWRVNNEAVQRSKLRVDTRKFLMAKMKPKRYGDKLDLTTGGKEMPAPIFGGQSLASNAGSDSSD